MSFEDGSVRLARYLAELERPNHQHPEADLKYAHIDHLYALWYQFGRETSEWNDDNKHDDSRVPPLKFALAPGLLSSLLTEVRDNDIYTRCPQIVITDQVTRNRQTIARYVQDFGQENLGHYPQLKAVVDAVLLVHDSQFEDIRRLASQVDKRAAYWQFRREYQLWLDYAAGRSS